MPDKPTWCGRLDEISYQLRALPDSWVDRSCLQYILGIGVRRAQQILAPCVARQLGASGLADRETLIAHLHRLASAETLHYEHQRRRRLAAHLDALHEERRKGLLVAAPVSIVNQSLEGLPEGISIQPGAISIHFENPRVALEKLLALAMAIRNDQLEFERLASGGA